MKEEAASKRKKLLQEMVHVNSGVFTDNVPSLLDLDMPLALK